MNTSENLKLYLAQFTSLQRGRIDKTMQVEVTLNHQNKQARYRHIEDLIVQGYTITVQKTFGKILILASTGSFFFLHMTKLQKRI